MFLRSLTGLIKKELNIEPSVNQKLERLGLFTISDLLLHYPRDWEDRTNIVPLSALNDAYGCAHVKVIAREFFGYGYSKAMKVYVEDEDSVKKGIQPVLLCFNLSRRSWFERRLLNDTEHLIYGRFKHNKNGEYQCSAFDFSSVKSKNSFCKIIPVYPSTTGLNQRHLRSAVNNALNKYADKLENELPDELIKRDNLLSKSGAVKEMHNPSSMEELEKAKKTLIYEELFYFEMMVGKRTIEKRRQKKQLAMNSGQSSLREKNEFSPLQKRLIERLPFSLTQGQIEAALEINRDIKSIMPMARLLQGDVGSGKTLVSFLAALYTVEKNAQAVIMAPTELLARQHAETAAKLLEPMGIRIAFLTGNIKAKGRKELIKNLKEGSVDIAAGTHALFSKDVEYKNLKLAVIDEQHRFGVTQRALITAKGNSPDLLMMSATPIPRTLALTVFGDMDVSVIKDMPPGRKPVITHLAKESNEAKVYEFVRRELEEGRQAYFVYPLIEDASSSGNEIKDAVSMAERLQKEIYPKFKIALIHSKIPEDEKKQIMDSFRKGEINLLAATSVVEVGVDVPNANCMVIEHAERFGLPALHQLRGRVGRGCDQSYCFLVYSDNYSDEGKNRLLIMKENTDGFIIAEEDLKMRGPGRFTGTEQSGYMIFGLASIIRDAEELEKARKDVFAILEDDPDLLLANHRVIVKVLEEAPPFGEVAF